MRRFVGRVYGKTHRPVQSSILKARGEAVRMVLHVAEAVTSSSVPHRDRPRVGPDKAIQLPRAADRGSRGYRSHPVSNAD